MGLFKYLLKGFFRISVIEACELSAGFFHLYNRFWRNFGQLPQYIFERLFITNNITIYSIFRVVSDITGECCNQRGTTTNRFYQLGRKSGVVFPTFLSNE